jgi:predicted DNA-binding transcriptional regulator AlpA
MVAATVNPEPERLPELPKPQRYLTAEEAIQFLGLRNKSALFYLHCQPDGPPFVRLTARRRVYALADLVAWAESRKSSKK